MSSSSASFSSCSIKLIRNCIPSLHLFSSSSRQSTITNPTIWPVDFIESICIETFGLTANTESEPKWVIIKDESQ